MDLVYNIDLVSGLGRGVVHPLDELAHVVHTGVAGGVYLYDVQRAPFGDGLAHGALVAGLALAAGSGLDAVDGLGQYAPGAGLARAARAAEEIGVRHVAAGECIKQGAGNMLLADDFGQCLGAPFAVENLSHDCGLLYPNARDFSQACTC